MNSLANSIDISIAQATELAQEIDHEFTSNFADGQSDAENNFEPIVYQWFNSDYRRGYLIGLAKRIGIEEAVIRGVEMNKIVFL